MRGMRASAPPTAGRVAFLLFCGSLVLAPRAAPGAEETPSYLAAMGGTFFTWYAAAEANTRGAPTGERAIDVAR